MVQGHLCRLCPPIAPLVQTGVGVLWARATAPVNAPYKLADPPVPQRAGIVHVGRWAGRPQATRWQRSVPPSNSPKMWCCDPAPHPTHRPRTVQQGCQRQRGGQQSREEPSGAQRSIACNTTSDSRGLRTTAQPHEAAASIHPHSPSCRSAVKWRVRVKNRSRST